MLDYFFMLDKLYGEEKSMLNTNTFKKGMWYQYIDREEDREGQRCTNHDAYKNKRNQ